LVGAGLAAVAVLAQAQHFHAPSGGFSQATMSRAFDGGRVTAVSADARPAPRPPADPQVRAGSIREDVARYNEERATFRPFARGSAGSTHPPMPSPYRN